MVKTVIERDNRRYFICRYLKLGYVLNLFINERLRCRNRFVLYYLNSNWISTLLEKRYISLIIEKLYKFSLSPLNYDISQMKNEENIPLAEATSRNNLYEVVDKVDDTDLKGKNSLFDYLNDKLGPIKDDLRLYVKRQIAIDIYEDLLLVNVTHWLATNKESKLCSKSIIMFIERKSYWIYLVLNYSKSKNVKFKLFQRINLRKNKGVYFTYHLFKLFAESVLSLVVIKESDKSSGTSKIGVSYYVFQNFTEFFDLRNYYLFWLYKSGIAHKSILIYNPEAECEINDEEISNIRKAGFNITFCSKFVMRKSKDGVPLHQCTFKTIPLLVQYLKQIAKMYWHAEGKFMKEELKLLSLLFVQLPYWEDFFQRNNIKIKFRFHDLFSLREIAAKLSGVTTLSYHYSSHSDTTILHQEICDVFFIWGKKYEKCLSSKYSTTKNLIQTGYIFDYTFDNLRSKAIALRDSFKVSGTLYTIGILDENLNSVSGKSMLNCYKAILEYVVRHPDIEILIKPKRETAIGYLKSSVEIAELVSILDEQGRIKFLNSNKYPVELGHASDIVIGMIPDSTAGLECALAGIPVVIYDCTHSKETHPYYTWGYNKVIFDDTSQLFKCLDENKTASSPSQGFADWSQILDDVDSFRDGKANQRVGFYLNTLLLNMDNGLTKEEAIAAANKIYSRKYGRDKVTSICRTDVSSMGPGTVEIVNVDELLGKKDILV